MKHRLSFALSAACVLAFNATLLSACGGRFQTVREVADDDSSGGRAGSGAGAIGGGGGGGGASNAGAGGNCPQLKCAYPNCPMGSTPIIPAGGCCPVCPSTCPPCPAVMCPAGSHAQLFDDCCPVCVLDDTAACMKGQQAYASVRNELLNKYRYGCSNASECTVIGPINQCENGCAYTAVWYGASDSFVSNLLNAADTYCSTCKQGPTPPCAPPSPPVCIEGRCGFDTLK